MLPDSSVRKLCNHSAGEAAGNMLAATGKMPALPNLIRSCLYAAPEKQSIQQQQDHCANDRHDPTSDVIFANKKATDPSAYKRARDA